MPALAYPLPRVYPITQNFGEVRLPTLRPHTGIDYGCPAGTLFLASAPGRAEVFYDVGGGTIVRVHVSPTFSYEGAHLLSPLVSTGQQVGTGDRLGLTGSSGAFVTGPHLHFEVDVNGQAVDPAPYLGGAAAIPGGAVGAPTQPAADPAAWVAKLHNAFAQWEGGDVLWSQAFTTLEKVKPLQLMQNPDYSVFGFTDASWQELKANVASLGLTNKPINPGDYGAIAARMKTSTAEPSAIGQLFNLALPPLLEPAIAITVLLVAGVLIYKGATEILAA